MNILERNMYHIYEDEEMWHMDKIEDGKIVFSLMCKDLEDLLQALARGEKSAKSRKFTQL